MKNEEYIDKEYESLTDIQKLFLEKYFEHKTVNNTCKAIDITYWVYQHWRNTDQTFMKYKKYVDECIKDHVEGKLFDLIDNKSFPAIKFYLEHNHPNYTGEEIDVSVSSSKYPVIRFVNNKEKYDGRDTGDND